MNDPETAGIPEEQTPGASEEGAAETPGESPGGVPEPAPLEVREAGGHYEFSDGDNTLFSGLAFRMSALGFFLVLLALIDAPAFLDGDGRASLLAVLYTVTGAWSFYTAYSVRSIATTEGSGIAHLLSALKSLRGLLTVTSVLVLILLVMRGRGYIVGLLG